MILELLSQLKNFDKNSLSRSGWHFNILMFTNQSMYDCDLRCMCVSVPYKKYHSLYIKEMGVTNNKKLRLCGTFTNAIVLSSFSVINSYVCWGLALDANIFNKSCREFHHFFIMGEIFAHFFILGWAYVSPIYQAK